jgi:hypothetical protein
LGIVRMDWPVVGWLEGVDEGMVTRSGTLEPYLW